MTSQIRNSVCALDCPDTCSLLVQIDATGRATKLRGNPDHPITRGYLCAKVAKYLEREYHPERLLFPLRRRGAKGEGRFQRISWSDALDEIAERLSGIAQQYGSEAILPYSYAGTMGLLNGAGMDRRFFHRLGASRLDRTICSAAGGQALALSQGIKLGTEPEQFAKSKLIIAWGANVLGTNVHLWPWIVEARRNGAKFFTIDPVKNRTGKLADRHFSINPGSDLALALGMIHIVVREGWHDSEYLAQHSNGFEEMAELAQQYCPERVSSLTGLSQQEIESLTRDYCTARPAVIRLNYGVQRTDRGGSAVRAISALPVITGSWREEGGGLQLTTSGAFELNRPALEMPELQLQSPLRREARLVNMSRFGEALLDLDKPPIKAVVVYNSNPAAIAPNQSRVLKGLRSDDLFTVVLEQFQTDTADFADIILPVTTFLEHTDLYTAYGHYYLQLARPVVRPPGETKSNVEIFRLLAERLGFTESCFRESEDDLIRSLLNSKSPYVSGITLEELEAKSFVRLKISPSSTVPFLPFAKGAFRTSTGKYDFGACQLDYSPPVESRRGNPELVSRFPLELISCKNDDSMNSTFGHRSELTVQTSRLEIHPSDAKARAIVQGASVEVFNERGSCTFTASLSQDVAPGVLRARSMRWNKFAPGGSGINQLTSARLTDLGDGPTFFSCLVEVKASSSSRVEQSTVLLTNSTENQRPSPV